MKARSSVTSPAGQASDEAVRKVPISFILTGMADLVMRTPTAGLVMPTPTAGREGVVPAAVLPLSRVPAPTVLQTGCADVEDRGDVLLGKAEQDFRRRCNQDLLD